MRKSPLLEQAWRYWTAQRNGAELPRRAALDPKAMGTILGHSMVLDRTRPGTVRVRLGGHVLHQLMGMEVRGLPIRAFFDIADRTRAMDLIEQAFTTPATLEFDLISDGADGIVTARMLVLPLLDTAGEVTKALAVLVTDRIVTDPPRRFQLTNATVMPVDGARAPDSLPRRRLTDHHLPVEIQAGMAEDPVPFDAAPSPVPWLRVVK
ncbi:PAS domain-containing protein [Jannaschia donghaensis]|uniref:PAS domain protein n=1 Tax=Jannaschia donghaensis TaxID=420998 RepID=A0A0M6YKL1_9RHOB|nr:PAS domain-containing protein [Jannaschia donghaensis]CTQ50470.1 PAS domain protein [Jannaschia donghaensis]